MHKSGLVDTHLCKDARFSWLVADTDLCSQLFKMFNWGQNHEKLVDASLLWKLHLKDLVNFSETRFANSRRQVYTNLHHDLKAIVKRLEDKIKASEERPGDGKLTKKAREAKQLLGKLVNVHFVLRLSGCSDIYGQYGKIVNVAQIVKLFPHEPDDKFMAEVGLSDHAKCLSVLNARHGI